jgi:hypothetical protein
VKVIDEITNGQVIKFFRLMKEVKPEDISSPEYATVVVSSAIKTGIVIGGTEEELQTMRTGSVVTISGKVNKALMECMRPDPN